jgi:CheY-like chemotaxis protein
MEQYVLACFLLIYSHKEKSSMKNVLVVDDEKPFLKSLTDGLSVYATQFNVLTAENGEKAIKILDSKEIDLLVTDLNMPVMNGLELLAHMSKHYPTIPAIVITAFGTPTIEKKLKSMGPFLYIEKPLDIDSLAKKILEGLSSSSGGFIRGIALPTFLQLVELEKKTYTLKVKSGGRTGHLYFVKGVLMDADTAKKKGLEAAYDVISWEDVQIEIEGVCRKKKNNINLSLGHLLMEGFRLKDEREKDEGKEVDNSGKRVEEEEVSTNNDEKQETINEQEVSEMAVKDKLNGLSSIDGFAGVAVFTPTGEVLASLTAPGSKFDPKNTGVLANNVLLNAQKASIEMGAGRGQLIHIQAENAHLIVRCLNEGTDPLKSQPGKAHIHLVLVLDSDDSIGLAKMKIGSVVETLAEDFRM